MHYPSTTHALTYAGKMWLQDSLKENNQAVSPRQDRAICKYGVCPQWRGERYRWPTAVEPPISKVGRPTAMDSPNGDHLYTLG